MSDNERNLVEFLEDELPKAIHHAIAELLVRASNLGFFAIPGPEMNAAWELGYRVLQRRVIMNVRKEELNEAVECGDHDRVLALLGELSADGDRGPMIEHLRAMQAVERGDHNHASALLTELIANTDPTSNLFHTLKGVLETVKAKRDR
jgi:hypothetical protein